MLWRHLVNWAVAGFGRNSPPSSSLPMNGDTFGYRSSDTGEVHRVLHFGPEDPFFLDAITFAAGRIGLLRGGGLQRSAN